MPFRIWPAAVTALLGAAALIDITLSPAAMANQRSETEIEEIVRNYLLENPEVIFEAVERYQTKQQDLARAAAREAAREYLPELRNDPAGHVIDAPSGEAEILVIEFFDYNCGFCRQATDFVFSLQEDNEDLEIILQELPVTNANSREPALLALAAADTDSYVGLHRAMMTSDSLVDGDRAADIARDLDISDDLINRALTPGERQDALHARLDRSMDIADALGIDGTPAFLIASADGKYIEVIPGLSEAGVIAAIEEARTGQRR